MSSAIDKLVEAAAARAPAQPLAPAAAAPALTGEVLPPTTYQPTALPTLAEIAQNARVPADFYLQVDKEGRGLRIGKEMQLPIDDFTGTVDMTAVKRHYVIRVDNGKGQQAKYVKSTNMITSTAGLPLDKAIRQVLLPGGEVKDPYLSFVIPVVLAKDIEDPKATSKFVAPAGKTVVVETSYSASMDFEAFLGKLGRLGLLEATIPVVVRSKKIRSAGGIEYGSVEFDVDETALAEAA